MDRPRTGDLEGSITILNDIVMVDTCHNTFVRTIGCAGQGVDPNVNYGSTRC